MTSIVFNRHLLPIIGSFIIASCCLAFAGRVAQCSKPPGGQVTCEDKQMASCAVDKQGEVDGACRNVPSNLSASQVSAWALSQVLGKNISVEETNKLEYSTILRRGQAKSDGKTINFSLPEGPFKLETPRVPEGAPVRPLIMQPGFSPSVTCQACTSIGGLEKCEKATGGSREKAAALATRKLCPEGVACSADVRTICK